MYRALTIVLAALLFSGCAASAEHEPTEHQAHKVACNMPEPDPDAMSADEVQTTQGGYEYAVAFMVEGENYTNGTTATLNVSCTDTASLQLIGEDAVEEFGSGYDLVGLEFVNVETGTVVEYGVALQNARGLEEWNNAAPAAAWQLDESAIGEVVLVKLSSP